MLNQNIINFLSPLLGSLLTILGGFIAVLYTQYTGDKEEKRKEAHEILDDLYRQTQIIEGFYYKFLFRLPYKEENMIIRLDEDYHFIISSMSQVSLMIDIYVEPLKDAFSKYVKTLDNAEQKIEAAINAPGENKTLNDIFDTISEATITFRKEIVKLLKKKGYTYF